MVSRVSSLPLANNIMIDPAVSSVSHLLETRHAASEALTLSNVPHYYPRSSWFEPYFGRNMNAYLIYYLH